MIRFTIRKSVANEIMKSLGKNDLEKLKAEVISILKNKENAELKKAAEFFEKDEKRYTHLEKSLSGEWLEKAGYGVGTVRIWKGKKYKKVSSSPVRWVRVFDKHDRGAATSMGRYIAQVERCQTVEELYNFCMKQRSLFQDENGVDLPIMDKLRSAIDKQSEKIESGKSEKNTAAGLGDSGDKDFGKKKDPEGKFNQGDKARDKRIGGVALWDGKVKSAIKSGDADKIKETISAIEKEYDSIKDGLKGDEKDFAETELKFRKRDADNALKEQEKKDSKLLSNGKTVKEVREQYGIKVDKKDVSKMSRKEEKTYTYETMGKKFTLKESEIKEELERATDLLNSQRNMLERAERYGETKLAKRIKTELKEFQYTADLWQDRLDKIKDGDYDETESEKHQNRSDAMKGNKNAKKYGASMDDKEPIAKATKVADGKVTIPNDPDIKSQMKQLIASRYTDYVGNTSYGDMLSEIYYDGENLVSTDAKVLKVIKIGKLDGIEPNKYVKIDISGKDNISINQMDKKVGQYPNYKRVIPNGNDQTFAIDNKLAKEKIEAMKRDGSIPKNGYVALEFDGDAIKIDGTVVGKTYGTKFDTDHLPIQADYILNVLGKNGEETNFNASDSSKKAITVTTNVSTDVIMPMVNGGIPDYEQNRKDFKEKQEFESERKAEAEKVKSEQDSRRIKAETKKELIGNRPDGIDADEYSSMIDFADDYYVKRGYDNSGERAYGMIKRMVDNAINQVNSKDYDFEEVLLNSDNKVSRKIFEMLTGERVGTNKQAAQRAWESWVGKEGVDAHNKKIADAEKTEKDRIAAEKKAKDDAEREKYHGFMDGKTPAGKGKAKDILEKKGNFGGKIMTYQELADKYIADGGHVSMQTYQTNSGKDKNYYYIMDKDGTGYEIPKTIYDYAKYIKDNPVKKSLADIIMLDEYEHEDFDEDYSDYDASLPELFNTIQEDVSAAFEEVYGY